MQAEFGLKRESNNSLFFNEWTNDSGVFQFHSQIELYFIDDGEMEVTVEDQCRILHRGEMSVALSYTPHGYRTPESSSSSALIIPTFLCEEFVEATRGKKALEPFITDRLIVAKIKSHISELMREDINDIERQGYIYVILGIVMDSLRFENTYSPTDDSLASKMLFYINENFKNDLTLASIAMHFGYTQSYVSRYFKNRFNVTLIRYLTLIKLKNAVMLMHEKKHSITFCALESGFSSMRTFYRAFSEEFGCSPKEYIKQT